MPCLGGWLRLLLAAQAFKEGGAMLYNVLQDAVINNRGVVLYLVEGTEVELPEEEAAFVIALGYVAEPEAPIGRKGKRAEIETPEKRLAKAEER